MYRKKTWFAREKMKDIYDENHEKSNATTEYWHYTSMGAILSIFKSFIESSDEGISTINLYASHNRFLNDSQEYEDGKQCLSSLVKHYNEGKNKEIIDEAAANTDANVYIVSFCSDGDLLSQWKWYGGESGISFCFNADKAEYAIYTELDENGKEVEDVVNDCFTRPLPVCYFPKEKDAYFTQLIKNVLVKPLRNKDKSKDGSTTDKIIDKTKIDLLPELFIPFCKNEFFHEEMEHRLVFFDYDDLICEEGHSISFNNKYNIASNGVVKPALNVKVLINKDAGNSSEEAHVDVLSACEDEHADNTCLVTKMIVGPGTNQHLYFNGLIHIFDRNHFRFQPEPKIPQELDKYGIFEENDELPLGVLFFVKDKKYQEKEGFIDYTHLKAAYKCHNGLLIMKSSIPFRG